MTTGWRESAKTHFSLVIPMRPKKYKIGKIPGLTEAIGHLCLDKNSYFCLFVFSLAMLNISDMGP